MSSRLPDPALVVARLRVAQRPLAARARVLALALARPVVRLGVSLGERARVLDLPFQVDEEPERPTPVAPVAPSSPLYVHIPHAHQPKSATALHQEARAKELAARSSWRARLATFNDNLAVWITKHSGSMGCAYAFAGIGIGSLVGIITGNTLLAAICGSLSSYFLQLVMLPVLQKGQNLLARHAELQAEETFKTAQGTYHRLGQVAQHLVAQDLHAVEAFARQSALLEAIARTVGATPPTPPAPPEPTPITRARRSRSKSVTPSGAPTPPPAA